jgi:peptide/nickel transport system substrate-binding protein
MMAVFNNLVLYDQHVAQNSLDTIVPELAESWSWSEDGTRLTFKLRASIRESHGGTTSQKSPRTAPPKPHSC